MLDTWSCFRTFGLCDLVRHGSSFINTRWWDGRCHRPQMSSPRSTAWGFGIPIKNAPSLSFGDILLSQCVGQLGFLHVNTSIYTRLRWHLEAMTGITEFTELDYNSEWLTIIVWSSCLFSWGNLGMQANLCIWDMSQEYASMSGYLSCSLFLWGQNRVLMEFPLLPYFQLRIIAPLPFSMM